MYRYYSVRSLVVAVGLLTLLAAGCADKQTTSSSQVTKPKQLNVCNLLPNADAAVILDGFVTTKPGSAVASGSGFVSTCVFTSDTARSVNVLLRQSVSAEQAVKIFSDSKAAAASGSVAPVDIPAVGDGAFWLGGTENQLQIVYKNNWLIFTVYGLTGDNRYALAKRVADVVLRGL